MRLDIVCECTVFQKLQRKVAIQMANILERLGDIMSANINAALDKMENPGKMVDQYLRKAKEDLAEVRANTASVMAEEKRCKRLVDEAQKEVDELAAYAEKAVMAGNDGDAAKFLTKKQQAAQRLADAQSTYATAKGHADQMRDAHDKLVRDIESLEARKENIKATAAVAKTQKTINKMTADAAGASGSLAAFDRMADKAQRQLDAAQAEAELNARSGDGTDELKAKYDAEMSPSVADELAALKAKHGKV